jgi:hypothetical protein
MRIAATVFASLLLALARAAAADEAAPIGYASVNAVLEGLRADPRAEFRDQRGWTVVASSERGRAVQWFFPPEAHPAHPAVVKRTVMEADGVGMIDVAALCHTPQTDCDRLLDDFRQVHEQPVPTLLVERVALDVGIALNDHDRVRIRRLVAEEGKAAEIRMDDVLKVVIVPTLSEGGGVVIWTAMYEFDGSDYVLVAEPQFASPGIGTAEIRMSSVSGNRFGFSITPLLAHE